MLGVDNHCYRAVRYFKAPDTMRLDTIRTVDDDHR